MAGVQHTHPAAWTFETMRPPGPVRVAILGLGLIGGSFALGVVDHARSAVAQQHTDGSGEPGTTVIGWDPDPQTRKSAGACGIEIAHSAIAAVDSADLVALCGPLKSIAATAQLIAPHLLPHAMITDVGSVKSSVRQAINGAGLNSRYVGAHPMAGLEQAGFSAASGQLLHGATWAVTVDEETAPGNFATLVRLVTTVFAARVIVLDDESHDSAAALISHVPHVLAHALLGHAAVSPHATVAHRLAAGSFRDGTRVAKSNPARNQAMVEDNRQAVVSSLQQVMADLTELVQALETEADPSEFFNRALRWGSPAKHSARVIEIGLENWQELVLELGAHGDLITGITVSRSDAETIQLNVEVP